MDDANALLHTNMWDIYVNEKENLVKGAYLLEVVGHDKKKVLWEVVNDHVIEEPTDHEEIGLRGFDLDVFNEDEEGVVREGSSEFPYILMLIKICPGNWISQLKSTNHKVDEDNGKHRIKVMCGIEKFVGFPEINFGRTLVVSFQLLPLVLGG